MLDSRFKSYIGICITETQYPNQREFDFYVVEFLPFVTGNVTEIVDKKIVQIFNVVTNQMEEKEVSVAKTIIAEYLGGDTNRSVPTMYRGMQVELINFADTDRFYWRPLERDDNKRTFEHIRWSIADKNKINKDGSTIDETDPESINKGLTDDNTYYIEMDTKYQKHVKISTSNSDGEKYRYFIEIDAIKNTLKIWDTNILGQSNYILLDSNIPQIRLENRVGSIIDMHHKDIEITAPNNFTLNVGNNFVRKIGGNVVEITGDKPTRLTKYTGPSIKDPTILQESMLGHETKIVDKTRTTTIGVSVDGIETRTVTGTWNDTVSNPQHNTFINLNYGNINKGITIIKNIIGSITSTIKGTNREIVEGIDQKQVTGNSTELIVDGTKTFTTPTFTINGDFAQSGSHPWIS